MDYSLVKELQDYLEPNEKLIWIGQPKPGIRFKVSDIFFIPFSLLWGGYFITKFIQDLFSGNFSFFILPFLIVGNYIIWGRFIMSARYRKTTFYGLTNKRIIIKYGVFKTKKIHSIALDLIRDPDLRENEDGSGTITLMRIVRRKQTDNEMIWFTGSKPTPQLEIVPDARRVFNLISEARKLQQNNYR